MLAPVAASSAARTERWRRRGETKEDLLLIEEAAHHLSTSQCSLVHVELLDAYVQWLRYGPTDRTPAAFFPLLMEQVQCDCLQSLLNDLGQWLPLLEHIPLLHRMVQTRGFNDVGVYLLFSLGRVPSCQNVRKVVGFLCSYTALPSLDESVVLLDSSLTSPRPEQPTRGVAGLDRLVSVAYEGSQDLTCCLCLQDLQLGQQVFVLSCGHVFHDATPELDCAGLKEWLRAHTTCPLCIGEVVP